VPSIASESADEAIHVLKERGHCRLHHLQLAPLLFRAPQQRADARIQSLSPATHPMLLLVETFAETLIFRRAPDLAVLPRLQQCRNTLIDFPAILLLWRSIARSISSNVIG